MPGDEVPVGRSGRLLGGLLAPLRLPERVLEALDSMAEATRELGPIRSELTTVGKQTEPLAELIPSLEGLRGDLATRLDAVREVIQALESDQSHLNRSVSAVSVGVGALNEALAPADDRLAAIEAATDRLVREVGAIHETLHRVQEDIQRITGLRGERGRMERARDVLTGGRYEVPAPLGDESPEDARRAPE